MIEQIEFGTRDEYRRAEEATERGMAAVVEALNDQLTVICGLAHLGGDTSYDVEQTERYFAEIESAARRPHRSPANSSCSTPLRLQTTSAEPDPPLRGTRPQWFQGAPRRNG